MRKLIGITVSLVMLAGVVLGQDTGKKPEKNKDEGKKTAVEKMTDPVEILKKADAACQAVKAVKMELTVEGDEAVAKIFPKIQASVIATDAERAGNYPTIKKYLTDLKYTRPNESEPKHITAGSDGENFFLIDHASKKAHVDIDPAVLGSAGRLLQYATMIEFLIDQPFNDEINGKEQKLLGTKTIEGEECYEIHVVYAAGSEATWYFSTKDFLPRCRVDITPLQDGTTGKLIKTIKKVDPNPKIDENTFKLKLPEGYTQTEDFAP